MSDSVSPVQETRTNKLTGRRWRRRLLFGSIVLLTLYLLHEPLLRLLAAALVVEGPPAAADALVVFGGDGCCEQAARSFHDGQVPALVLIERRLRRLERLGILPSPAQLKIRQLRRLGVPADALEILPGRAGDDWAAARLLGNWLARHPNGHVALLCDHFGSRRLSYILHHELGEDAIRVTLQPLPPRHYDPAAWWHERAGMNAFTTAYLRLGYAWIGGAEAEDEWRESDLVEYEANLR